MYVNCLLIVYVDCKFIIDKMIFMVLNNLGLDRKWIIIIICIDLLFNYSCYW